MQPEGHGARDDSVETQSQMEVDKAEPEDETPSVEVLVENNAGGGKSSGKEGGSAV